MSFKKGYKHSEEAKRKMSESRKGKKHWNWKGGKIERYCLLCNQKFFIKPSVIKCGGGKYCSVECHNKASRSGEYFDCKKCGKIFYVSRSNIKRHSNKFCSQECYHDWMKGENHHMWLGGKIQKICECCKKSFKTQYSAKNKRFCSVGCKRKWFRGQNHSNWHGGISFEPYGLGFNKQLKEQIRERDNFTCQECKYTEKQLGHTLDVHHIDYNKRDSNPNNLISLCKFCHGKTCFNREDWRKYYKDKINVKVLKSKEV